MNQRIEKARIFAQTWHGEQKYGEEPYIKHLDHVYEIATKFELNETIQIATYLHDILEDTECTFEKIWKQFGWEVAQLVFLVTDELGRNRQERKQKTYSKIRSNPDAILLKLCDRIANIDASSRNNQELFQMYKNEHEEFLTELFIPGTRYGLLGQLIAKLNELFEL